MSWLTDPRYAELNQHAVAWVLAIGLLGTALLWNHRLRHDVTVRRFALGALIACTLVASCANFFQSRNNGKWIHRWDLFHTIVGAKYFAELGYDHLYDCAYVLASAETPHAFSKVRQIRDLGTLEYVRPKKILKNNDCRKRFSKERAAAFVADIHAFGRLGLQSRWHEAFKDKGYNGTPFYTLITRAISNRVSIEYGDMLKLALIDIVLLVVAVVVVARTRGIMIACLVLAGLATCYPARFVHMGGSLLRFDYLAALIIGFCALSTRRTATAGFLFAYATLIRIFPALFVIGVLIAYAAQGIRDRKLSPEMIRFCAGGLVGLVVLGGATFVFSHGAHDWSAWWTELQSHTRNSAAFRVGFKHMFMLDGNVTGEEGFIPYPEKVEHFEGRYGWYVASAILLIGPLLTRAWRWDPTTFGVFFGTVTFFIGLIATRYYYAVLVLPLLADPRVVGERAYLIIAGLLSLAAASTYAIQDWNSNVPFIYNVLVGAQLTLLTAALAVWSAWQLWRGHVSTSSEAAVASSTAELR